MPLIRTAEYVMTAGLRIRIIHGVLRPPLNVIGSRFFRKKLGTSNASEVMRRTWKGVAVRLSGIPRQHPLGPTVIVYLGAATCSIQEALVARGLDAHEAATLIEELAWVVYRRMGQFVWVLTRLRASEDYRRLLFATRLFRRFPFGSPGYEWKDVPSEEGVVAFDCLRCPAAEYFSRQHKAELCVRTFCNLDFPLAQMWHAELQRTGSLAGGAKRCDFRWRAVRGHGARTPEGPAAAEQSYEEALSRHFQALTGKG